MPSCFLLFPHKKIEHNHCSFPSSFVCSISDLHCTCTPRPLSSYPRDEHRFYPSQTKNPSLQTISHVFFFQRSRRPGHQHGDAGPGRRRDQRQHQARCYEHGVPPAGLPVQDEPERVCCVAPPNSSPEGTKEISKKKTKTLRANPCADSPSPTGTRRTSRPQTTS